MNYQIKEEVVVILADFGVDVRSIVAGNTPGNMDPYEYPKHGLSRVYMRRASSRRRIAY
jgi:hypothetical protein